MRALIATVAAGALALLAPGTANAAPAPYPPRATCVDTAHALGAGVCARITSVLAADAKASPDGDEIAVAVVPSTGSASIEAWSTGLFNSWDVGERDTDNGVLLVVALTDHKLRIATGDGLSTRLPDGSAAEIIGGTITPLLKAGRTEDAVLAGLDGIRTALGHDVAAHPLAGPGSDPGGVGSDPGGVGSDPAAGSDPAIGGDPLFGDQGLDPGSGGGGSGAGVLLFFLAAAVVVVVVFVSFASGNGGFSGGSSAGQRRRPSSFGSFGSSSSSSYHSPGSSSSDSSGGSGGGQSSGGGASGSW